MSERLLKHLPEVSRNKARVVAGLGLAGTTAAYAFARQRRINYLLAKGERDAYKVAFLRGERDGIDALSLEAKSREEAGRDPLTNLYNRRRFAEQFSVQTAYRPPARRRPADTNVHSLLLLDLDKFKAVNDTYGHGVGDRVLMTVANLLNERLREGDVVARLGGEEFGVLLPNTTAGHAHKVAEDLRTGIAGEEYCTASFGLVEINRETDPDGTVATYLHMADRALYQAKTSGRNRVVAFPNPPEAG